MFKARKDKRVDDKNLFSLCPLQEIGKKQFSRVGKKLDSYPVSLKKRNPDFPESG